MSNDDLLNEFLIESLENLSQIEDKLTKLEQTPDDIEILNSIYRTVHTLKGSASFLGFNKLQGFTHTAENFLDLLRENQRELTTDAMDVLFATFDHCEKMVRYIEENKEEGEFDFSDNLKRLETLIAGQVSPPTEKTEIQASNEEVQQGIIKDDESVDTLNSLLEKHKAASGVKESNQVEQASVKQNESKVELTPTSENRTQESGEPTGGSPLKKSNLMKSNITDSVVRVNVNLLDKIMNVVGELVLNRNQILQYANFSNESELLKLSQQLNIITTELQTDIMKTRMQPIGSVLNKYDRLVRDFAKDNDKKIKLVISGQETELDKTLIEAIKDPITHIIRNSADHGLEPTHERVANDKDETGVVSIRAYHESGQVTLEISDDGRGLNKQKIIDKAIERGVINTEEASRMSDESIFSLIFAPGFSTAEKVTNISGRGVGMDVVKTNIEKIGGTVSVSSELGRGTTFKLKIPLTLAIIPALIIKSHHETFAIPQLNLVELVRFDLSEQKESPIEKIHESEFFRLRGKLIPVFRVNKELELTKVHQKSIKINNLTDQNKDDNDNLNIVILNAEGLTYGLIVDEILDTEEIVVKPLGRSLKNIACFAGATIMGDGSVALILDAVGFVNDFRDASHDLQQTQIETAIEEKAHENEFKESQENLLFTLEDQRLYGIPLCLVNRLEDFKFSDIEMTGDQHIIRYGNCPMPLIEVEKTLQLADTSILDRARESKVDMELNCIVVRIRDRNFGLVVTEIMDIAVSDVNISSNTIDRDGLLGTIFINDKTISLLDIYNIIDAQSFVEKRAPSEVESKFSGHKVLLIDDSAMYRKMEGEALIQLGFEIITAIDGKDGLEKLAQNTDVRLIVSDIEMPQMNGFEFAEKVRQNKIYDHIPMIALTTRFTEEDRARGSKVGYKHYLEKFKKDEVLDIIGNVVSQEV